MTIIEAIALLLAGAFFLVAVAFAGAFSMAGARQDALAERRELLAERQRILAHLQEQKNKIEASNRS